MHSEGLVADVVESEITHTPQSETDAKTSQLHTGESSPAGKNGLMERVQHVTETALYLHSRKAAGDFDAFREACISVGIDGQICGVDASEFYWRRMPMCRSGAALSKAKSSSAVSDILGIQLQGPRDHDPHEKPSHIPTDTPRNRLLYHLFQLVAGDLFCAEITDGQHLPAKEAKVNASLLREAKRKAGTTGVVQFEGFTPMRSVEMFNLQRGREPWYHNIASIFRGETPKDVIDNRIAQSSLPLCSILGDEIGLQLGELLYQLQMIFPDSAMASLIGNVIKKGLAGEKIIFAGAFCPDYAYEKTGNPNLPYRYTFDNVGEGVGLVAQQFARVMPPLSTFMTKLGIQHEIVLGIGDFEADSQKILTRVKLDYAEFVRRCAKSLDAFRLAMPQDFQITLELCDADRCKGRLRPYAAKATARMMSGDFGQISELYGDPEVLVNQIVKDSATFYRRWYERPDMPEWEIREIVLGQGGEYAALSEICFEDFGQNLILISGDRPKMHSFDSFFRRTPVFSVKRAY